MKPIRVLMKTRLHLREEERISEERKGRERRGVKGTTYERRAVDGSEGVVSTCHVSWAAERRGRRPCTRGQRRALSRLPVGRGVDSCKLKT